MKNRSFNVDPKRLNYHVTAPKHYVKGQKIDLKTRAVIGIFPPAKGKTNGEKRKVIYAKSVPDVLTIGPREQKHKKQQPVDLIKIVDRMKEKVRLVSIDLLNEGAQVALTIGTEHPADPIAPYPIKIFNFEGWLINMYRVMVYRYDQLKNDFFIEVVIQKPIDHPAEKPKTVHCFFPVSPLWLSNASSEGGKRYEDKLEDWFEQAQNPLYADAGKLRNLIYYSVFNARKDSDFKDRSSTQYAQFSELRTLLLKAESRLGNNALAVFLAFSYWYWTNQGRDTLENDMMGYYGKKYNTLVSSFMKAADSEDSMPMEYEFTPIHGKNPSLMED